MEITLDKTFSNLHIGESELNQARTSNDKVGVAYGDAQKNIAIISLDPSSNDCA